MTPLEAGLSGAGVAIFVVLLCRWLRVKVRYLAFKPTAALETGEQRRRRAPHDAECWARYPAGSYEYETAVGKDMRSERGYVPLSDGRLIFYQTYAPADGQEEIRAVVILIHGYGDHCDGNMALAAKTLVNSGPFAAMSFDLPGHGRSDGMHVHIPDWPAFVAAAREVIEKHLKPMAKRRWGAFKDLKFFGFGHSMGGGVLFTLLSDDSELMDGAVLVCPMLFVSKAVKPHWCVTEVLSKCIVPAMRTWPVAPSKSLGDFTHEDQEFRRQLRAVHSDAPGYRARPRLGTGIQLVLAGDDMRRRVSDFNVPSLILHGGGDRVTDPDVSRELFDKMKHPDKQLIMPDGVWHSDLLFGGPAKRDDVKRIFDAITTWMANRCATGV